MRGKMRNIPMDDFLFMPNSCWWSATLSFIAFWGAVIYFGIKITTASGVLLWRPYRDASRGSSYADISRDADTRLGAMGGPLPR